MTTNQRMPTLWPAMRGPSGPPRNRVTMIARHGDHVHELGQVEEGEADRRVLGVEAAGELLLGLDQVERRPVHLGRDRDQEDDERHDPGADQVPVVEEAAVLGRRRWRWSAASRSTSTTRGDRQADGRLVGDHLGRRPHRAEQRVLGARRPAGQHHAVDRDRRHHQQEQDPPRRVGQLQPGGVAGDGDRAADRARWRTSGRRARRPGRAPAGRSGGRPGRGAGPP